ncbi:MAG: hypothetical protein NTZ20_04630 [Candidatus Levybacteria bacterium]|nr:hypothetical protein [Candidatus Levybacteria bacterium]
MKLIIALLSLIFIILSSKQALALTMSNSNWTIQFGNFNSGAGKTTNLNYKMGVTIGQTAAGMFSGTNYKTRSGFQYINVTSAPSFSISISELLIDFGSLSPGNPSKRTNTIRISNGPVSGYTVTASESSQLRELRTGDVIADTTCDDGSCTEAISSSWDSPLTYGFGYRCDNITGTDCTSDFTTDNYYKQFANSSIQESPQKIMSGIGDSLEKEVKITYKVNISNSQVAGQYSNFISFIATPVF